jgi:hypothetical protein
VKKEITAGPIKMSEWNQPYSLKLNKQILNTTAMTLRLWKEVP